ncbi:MAG: dTDP-glucose 4,6-dehydratase [Betaproteobacteria bacterium]|nr:dTDP-glucose 4,6-dehydratase [Betaproteobacteria bacterium]
MILVTGGAGFIGSNFIAEWLGHEKSAVINLDNLTYAGNQDNLKPVANDARYVFAQGDINDRALIDLLLRQHKPHAIVHFAAESHVDRSIHGPDEFVQSNIVGTFNLLEATRAYLQEQSAAERASFRFLHVSTDEVYGSLPAGAPAATESTPYDPQSPYSASKAAADHLVRAYANTYRLPAIVTNCSNNYGPRQFPEKLIPLTIVNACAGKHLPVYGDGLNVRDWLYVTDHCTALRLVLSKGRVGDTYNIGGNAEKTNIEVVRTICSILDELKPASEPHERLIEFVPDRPGHDRRYALDCTKLTAETGWRPAENFASGLRKTVQWYLDHPDWIARVVSGDYKKWITTNYEARDKQ